MFWSLTQYFKVRKNAIQVYSLYGTPQVYNNCYNTKLHKIVKPGCKLAGGSNMYLLERYIGTF